MNSKGSRVFPDEFGIVHLNRPQHLPPIYVQLIVLPLEAIWFELLK